MPPLLIHAGFSKTGTTTLQLHLFAKHPQLKYLGKPYPDERFAALLRDLIQAESLDWDPGGLRRHLAENRLLECGGNRRAVVLSEEMLLSYSKARDKGLVAERLHQVFAPCRVLITIRNQFDLLLSAYLSRGRLLLGAPPRFNGLAVSFPEWLEITFAAPGRSYAAHADFYRTISFYARRFGRENLLVLTLEELVSDPPGHLGRLCAFLGVDAEAAVGLVGAAHEHRDIPASQLEYERLCTAAFPLHRLAPLRGALRALAAWRTRRQPTGAAARFPEDWRERVAAYYRPGNRRLAEEFALPLDGSAYPL